MFVVNVIVAFVLAFLLWYLASWLLAQAMLQLETRNPRVIGRGAWNAVESLLTLAIFIGSVAAWVGLTYFLQQINP